MQEPRLRTVNKATPPYAKNNFPDFFVQRFAAEIVYLLASKSDMSLEGSEWEQVFANCIGADWKPSNVGLDDVVLSNCCWSAKTVKGNRTNFGNQSIVRLICGRNSPTYSYGEDRIREADPNHIGQMVLDIWNERVSGIRQIYKFARTIVLVKSADYTEYLIFELDTIRYDADQYVFEWNQNGNLEGYQKGNARHCFTWQPHGSQFTIIEDIPEERLHLRIKKPVSLDKITILKSLGFSREWVEIINDK